MKKKTRKRKNMMEGKSEVREEKKVDEKGAQTPLT